jgi:hypothetical protein
MHGLNIGSGARSEKTLDSFVPEITNHPEIVACSATRRKMGVLALGHSSNPVSHQNLKIASLSELVEQTFLPHQEVLLGAPASSNKEVKSPEKPSESWAFSLSGRYLV